MATKGHSFKLNLEDPTEKRINDFLAGKPTTHIIIGALELYIRFEEARKAAIDNAINAIGNPTMSSEQYRKLSPVKSDNDDLEDFEL